MVSPLVGHEKANELECKTKALVMFAETHEEAALVLLERWEVWRILAKV
jgi:hypothetical protein